MANSLVSMCNETQTSGRGIKYEDAEAENIEDVGVEGLYKRQSSTIIKLAFLRGSVGENDWEFTLEITETGKEGGSGTEAALFWSREVEEPAEEISGGKSSDMFVREIDEEV